MMRVQNISEENSTFLRKNENSLTQSERNKINLHQSNFSALMLLCSSFLKKISIKYLNQNISIYIDRNYFLFKRIKIRFS